MAHVGSVHLIEKSYLKNKVDPDLLVILSKSNVFYCRTAA
jgi:hypothetical protein